MDAFTRVTSPGTTDHGRLFVTVRFDGRRLSITGVEGPRENGDCRGGCGQTGIPVASALKLAKGWDLKMVEELRAAWNAWHLNDMRAGCVHQRATWNVEEPLTLQHLGWGERYSKTRQAAANCILSAGEYAEFQGIGEEVLRLTVGRNLPKHPDLWGADGRRLLADGWLRIEKEETKTAGWVTPAEHPRGLLEKPCDVCGYRYGSAWLFEEVPLDVLEFLWGLPDASKDLPAAWRS